jgi:hypothetical protein
VILLIFFVNLLLKQQSTQLPHMKAVISHENFLLCRELVIVPNLSANFSTEELNTAQNGNSNSSSNQSFLSLKSNLKICHINIEEISISKSKYLVRLIHDEDIGIVTVQKTHAGSEENLRRRGTIPG